MCPSGQTPSLYMCIFFYIYASCFPSSSFLLKIILFCISAKNCLLHFVSSIKNSCETENLMLILFPTSHYIYNHSFNMATLIGSWRKCSCRHAMSWVVYAACVSHIITLPQFSTENSQEVVKLVATGDVIWNWPVHVVMKWKVLFCEYMRMILV